MASILNNIAALGATRQLGITNVGMQKTIERLTSGKRINRANDDASGLVTANALSYDIRVAAQGRRNANDGLNTLQTQDGYLEEATNLALRAAELEAKGSTPETDAEVLSLQKAMSDIVGKIAGTVTVTAGSFTSTTTLTTTNVVLGATAAAAGSKAALDAIGTLRGTIGADMQKLTSYSNVLGIEGENKTAQMSQIMDANIGEEVVNLSKWQILNQSGISALSQANQAGQSVLALLQ